jgi:serine/threonine-protein kinase
VKEGDLIQERYRLEAPLGAGGMAEVWRALDQRLNRPVAIKLLARHLADQPDFLVRFFSEAQCVARLSDPAVVKVLDFGQEDDLPYLVMELVPGGPLVVPEGEQLLPERAFELVAQAAGGAGAAHAAGLVHRDIKPANILLDDLGNAKLADFGIASSTGAERMTGTGAAIGSPHYIAPERVSGGDATPASDVYSLGVVLYELLAGRRPFEGGNATMIAISHIDQEPDPPSAHNPALDPGVDEVVMRCLAKDPADRFPDGNALAEVLERGKFGGLGLAAAAEHPETLEDEPDGYEVVEARTGRRILVGSAVMAAVVALAVWGLGATRGGADPDQGIVSSDSEDQGKPGARPSPTTSSSPGTFEEELVSSTPSPSPTSPTARDGGETRDGDWSPTAVPGADSNDTTDDPDPDPTPDSEPSPSPTTAEPSPTSEPSEEPSPAPSPSTEPSPAPEGGDGTSSGS